MAKQTEIQKRINKMAGIRGNGKSQTYVVSRKNEKSPYDASGKPKSRKSGLDGYRDRTGTRGAFGNRKDRYRDIRAAFGLTTG